MYSTQDFVRKVNDKPGNIAVFRRMLRDFGMLENNQPLTDSHANLFREAKRIKQQQNIKWVTAFECVLRGDAKEQEMPSPDESTLEQLNRTMLRIAEALEKIERHLSAKQ